MNDVDALYQVRLSPEAEKDLIDIWQSIADREGVEKADKLINQPEQKCLTLRRLPKKRFVPSELRNIGVFDFREARYEGYRIIYEVDGKEVLIHAFLDSRRNVDYSLMRRLTRL